MKDLNFYGNIHILPSSDVDTFGNGSLTIDNELNVTGSTNLNGALVSQVSNTLSNTTINTLTTNGNVKFNDNILIKDPNSLNVDSAVMVGLYQDENDSGTGEIISLNPPRGSGNFQSHVGLTANQVKLDATNSSIADFYNEYYIKVISGPFNNQVRKIVSYNGGFSKIAQINTAWSLVAVAGSITVSPGSVNVVGVGTSFITAFDIGDLISINNVTYTISNISDDTHLTLSTSIPTLFEGIAYYVHPKINASYILNNERYTLLALDKPNLKWRIGYTTSTPTTSILDISRLGTLQVDNIETVKINGNPAPYANDTLEVVNLIDNVATSAEITNSKTRGSFMIMVESISVNGACATFMVSKSYETASASINKLTDSPSQTGEVLSLTYIQNEKIKLYHSTTKTGGTGNAISYNVKTMKL